MSFSLLRPRLPVVRRKIVILTGNHVCHNPRAFKEAEALTEAGFDVEWLGGWINKDLASRDFELVNGRRWRYFAVGDWTEKALRFQLRRFWQRLRRRAGLAIFLISRRGNVAQLGYFGSELLREAKRRDADLYIAHSEIGLWAAEMLRRTGKLAGVDMEDWFSEDLLGRARRERPLKLLKHLERTLLQNARHATCTSNSMAAELATAYDCRPPVVIYNAFPWTDRKGIDAKRKDRTGTAAVSLHWFSQTIAPGRGLECLFEALRLLTVTVEVHLRGTVGRGCEAWLRDSIPEKWRERVVTHGIVSNQELLSRIAEHDIGLALEPTHPPNKNVTVSNKVMQYLLGGLAVVASDTAGHREVAALCPQGVRLFRSDDPLALSASIEELVLDQTKLRLSKLASLTAAKTHFCWEPMGERLASSVESLWRGSSKCRA